MRYATVEADGGQIWGAVEGDRLRILGGGKAGRFATIRDALAEGPLPTPRGDEQLISLANVRWLPPIPEPGKILCIGLNYENHRKETGRAVVAYPTVFTRFADTQTAHQGAICLPRESDKLDYEGELAVIIGKPCRRVSASDAMSVVAGYSCYNDASVRDWQGHTIQFTPGKNWPETGAFGPWLVTPDEFGALGPQRLQTRLNAEVMQEATLGDMIFPVDQLIEYCSTFTALSAGDVIVSGTPGGVGAKRTPPLFMKAGDRVEVEIDGIGILSNSIMAEAA